MEPTTHRQVENATAPSAGGFPDPDGESGRLRANLLLALAVGSV